jgi:vacuolar protein sorting-associated protein 54
MESDINYFITRLGKINGFGDVGDHLLGIVMSKRSKQNATRSSTETQLKKNDGEGENLKADNMVDEDTQKASMDNSNSSN